MKQAPTDPATALLGRTVTAVRRLQPTEVPDLDRPHLVTVVELDDGTLLVGSLDEHFAKLGRLWARDTKSKAWATVESPPAKEVA